VQERNLSDGKSVIVPIADIDNFAVKVFQEFRQFLFRVFNDIGDFHFIKSTDNRAASDTLDETKFLPGFRGNGNSLKFMVFT